MSLTGSRTLIRRSAAQWREIQQRFEHSGQTQVAFCTAEGLALSTFTTKKRHKQTGFDTTAPSNTGAGYKAFDS